MIHISHLHGNAILNRICANALARPSSIAITDVPHELSVTYPQLCSDVLFLALRLISAKSLSRGVIGGSDLRETRVAILCEKGYLVPLALLGIWAAGGLAVPILPSLPIPEQSYMTGNSGAGMIVTDAINKARAEDLAQQVRDGTGGKCVVVELNLADLRTEAKDEQEQKERLEQTARWMNNLKKLDGQRRAMMLYTSGTVRRRWSRFSSVRRLVPERNADPLTTVQTGRPKGVVTRHSAIDSQVSAVAETWHWSHTVSWVQHLLSTSHASADRAG
jgi:malonyl-CoA/methylmalonyl-CoA synthetase